MELSFSSKDLEFRDEVRDFLANEYPKHVKEKIENGEPLTREDIVDWHKSLSAKGWMGFNWPVEYGGTGWSASKLYIFNKELGLAGCPPILPFGVGMVGPVIYTFGNDEQKERFLPDILNFNTWWCQGYSEPGSGSDLASLKTKAVLDGDHYVVNGSKTWTTLAQNADWIFCLVRTDNTGKKQEGITFLMMDMNQPGVKVEPILTMAQDHDFNQVVFTDAVADVKDRIGKENEGWSVAKYLLEFERSGGVGGSKSLSDIQFIKKLMNKISATHNDTSFIDVYSTKVTELEIKAQSIQYTALRILSSLKGGDSPGPESSMMKTLVTDLEQEISEVTLEIIGYYGIPFQDTSLGSNEPAIGDESFRPIAGKYQNLRATTIYGGSNEIQRNVISKAILGL